MPCDADSAQNEYETPSCSTGVRRSSRSSSSTLCVPCARRPRRTTRRLQVPVKPDVGREPPAAAHRHAAVADAHVGHGVLRSLGRSPASLAVRLRAAWLKPSPARGASRVASADSSARGRAARRWSRESRPPVAAAEARPAEVVVAQQLTPPDVAATVARAAARSGTGVVRRSCEAALPSVATASWSASTPGRCAAVRRARAPPAAQQRSQQRDTQTACIDACSTRSTDLKVRGAVPCPPRRHEIDATPLPQLVGGRAWQQCVNRGSRDACCRNARQSPQRRPPLQRS